MAFVESEVVELKAEVVGDICKEVIALPTQKAIDIRIVEVLWESKTPTKSFCS